jgi:hypothetical protein
MVEVESTLLLLCLNSGTILHRSSRRYYVESIGDISRVCLNPTSDKCHVELMLSSLLVSWSSD